jgi:hypothetical protein
LFIIKNILSRFSPQHLKFGGKKVVNGEDDNFGVDLKNEFLFILGSPELEPEQFGSVVVGRAEALVRLLPYFSA